MSNTDHDDNAAFELGFVHTDLLIKELITRFDHAVFAGSKLQPSGATYLARQIEGNRVTCAGLAAFLGDMSIRDFHEEGTDVDDDEPPELGSDDTS